MKFFAEVSCCLLAFLQLNGALKNTSKIGKKDSFKRETGLSYDIFCPLMEPRTKGEKPVFHFLSPPEAYVHEFEEMLRDLDLMTTPYDNKVKVDSLHDRAIFAYTEILLSFVSAKVFGSAEKQIVPHTKVAVNKYKNFNESVRLGGEDWTYFGTTMTGYKRLINVRDLLNNVISKDITGDYMETGVWRGGSSAFARGIIRAHGEGNKRRSFVCDSFSGLPPADNIKLHQLDLGWDHTPYLEVSSETVANNFRKYNLLDPNVIFVKGYFNNTMPPLRKHIKQLSILRLDGDMYRSTVDVLYYMYDRLSINGYVIVDDWYGFPARIACEDFFKVHKINPVIVKIDEIAVYWQKTEQVELQMWRYHNSTFI